MTERYEFAITSGKEKAREKKPLFRLMLFESIKEAVGELFRFSDDAIITTNPENPEDIEILFEQLPRGG